MGTITLPNFRATADVKMNTRLKDGGVYIEWSSLTDIKAWIYSDAQKAIAGRCDVSVNPEDYTKLLCEYAASKPQYLGVNRLIVQGRYLGSLKTYDKPVFNFVSRTAEQADTPIVITDPEVDVEIEVTDTTSSILDNAIAAALQAAEDAEHAAHLVPLEVLQQCEQATEEAQAATEAANEAAETAMAAGIDEVEASIADDEPGTPSVDAELLNKVLSLVFHHLKGAKGEKGDTGATPNIAVGTVATGEPGTPVVVTITGTAEEPVLNITIPQGLKGDQGNTGSSVDYPFELVNNLTTDDATKALTAAQGKVLDGKVSQLQHKVDDLKENGDFSKYLYNYKDNIKLVLENGEVREVSDSNYITTDYVDVTSRSHNVIKAYVDSSDENTALYLYNSNKEYRERYSLMGYESSGRSITPQASDSYIRVTYKKPASSGDYVQVYIHPDYVTVWQPETQEIAANIYKLQDAFSYSRKFSSLFAEGSVTSGKYLITKSAHIFPNSALSAHIEGAFTNIKVGCGYNGSAFEHYAFYAEVTATDIKIYYVEAATPLQETLSHGLTLDNKTDITIITDNNNSYVRHSYIILTNSKGDQYKHELLCWFGSGNAFVKNDSSASIDAEIRLFPRSTTKPIWLFGDSYFSLWNNNRWPYYLYENGFTNALFNHLGGQSPSEGFEDLQNLLQLGYAPKMLVWCHGMNGDGDTYVDGQYIIDPTKKVIVDWLVEFCATNQIVLVLATIPTALIGSTPLLHEGYNNYVRSLGVRYIDFAEAVGAQPDGTWTEGLCADGVHPTIAGAKVLFARAMSDCPELATN